VLYLPGSDSTPDRIIVTVSAEQQNCEYAYHRLMHTKFRFLLLF